MLITQYVKQLCLKLQCKTITVRKITVREIIVREITVRRITVCRISRVFTPVYKNSVPSHVVSIRIEIVL